MANCGCCNRGENKESFSYPNDSDLLETAQALEKDLELIKRLTFEAIRKETEKAIHAARAIGHNQGVIQARALK